MRLLQFVIILALLIPVTKTFSQTGPKPAAALPSCLQKANNLLDEAFTFMEKNYYRKNSVEWDTLISAAKRKLSSSGNCDETYDIISWCFKELNESHSFIMPPSKAAIYNNEPASLTNKPTVKELVGEIKGELLENGVAYITVPWVSTTDSAICTMVADSLQQLIAAMDTEGTNGWIIDLRKNTGGNCWPMLAGIGPLLGEGVCGYFVSAREKIAISYKDGAASQGKYVRCRVSNNGYKVKSGKMPIIVLTGHRTVSSGEIIALAFKGKEQVYLYGEPTAGYTTANATYTLSDNSMLVLTVCMEADRNGKICEGRIIPDQTITTETSADSKDPAKAAALLRLAALR
ncbi:MAG TPA: S41 family peptidase [Chitinophagaceae bacterium]|jgi:carboxyl-terminal processing protease|nr:S41 family peptidase [Chitinophagaceae bacterium]